MAGLGLDLPTGVSVRGIHPGSGKSLPFWWFNWWDCAVTSWPMRAWWDNAEEDPDGTEGLLEGDPVRRKR